MGRSLGRRYGSGAINTDRMNRLYVTPAELHNPGGRVRGEVVTDQAPGRAGRATRRGMCRVHHASNTCEGTLQAAGVVTTAGVHAVQDRHVRHGAPRPEGRRCQGKLDAFLCCRAGRRGEIAAGVPLAPAARTGVLQTYKTGFVDQILRVCRRRPSARLDKILAQLHADGTDGQAVRRGPSARTMRLGCGDVRHRRTRSEGQLAGAALAGRARVADVGGRSLLGRLVATFLLLSVAMVGVVGTLAYVRARASLQESVYSRLAAAQDLDHGVARALGPGAATQHRLRVRPHRGCRARRHRSDTRGSVQLLLDPTSSPRARVAAADAVRATLSFAVGQTADAQELFLIDLDGRIVVSTNNAHEGTGESAQDYVRNGGSARFITPISALDLTEGRPTMVVAAPLFDETGQRQGILAGVLDLARLDRIVLQRTRPRPGRAHLPGRRGHPPGPRRVHDDGPTRRSRRPGIDDALAGRPGRGLYPDYQDTPVIGTYTWLPVMGPPWSPRSRSPWRSRRPSGSACRSASSASWWWSCWLPDLPGRAPDRAADPGHHPHRRGRARRRPQQRGAGDHARRGRDPGVPHSTR